jgi:hypothetical protein
LIEGMIHERLQPILGAWARIVGCHVKAMAQKDSSPTRADGSAADHSHPFDRCHPEIS